MLQVDHIVPKFRGGTDDRSNLRILCGDCHRKRHSSTGNAPTTNESAREKQYANLAISESSGELTIAPTLWASWLAWMKERILTVGYVLLQDAIYESARELKQKWGYGSSVTTRRYLKEASSPGGDFAKIWNVNLGWIIKFSEKVQKRLENIAK